MRRTALVAAALGLALLAAPVARATLPDKTALSDFLAVMQKAAGVAIEAAEQDGAFTGTIRNIGSVRFFEDSVEDRDLDEIVQFVLRGKSRECTAFRPTGLTREDLGATTMIWVSVRCLYAGIELHGEEFIIADAARYQNYSLGGPAENRERIAAIAANLFNALLAAHR